MMASLKLTLIGATIAIIINISESKAPEVKERHIRSLTSHLKSLLTGRRFVTQLATDCGMECKRRRATQEAEEQLSEAKKRFMSLGAADCGSFECVLKKRAAMGTVKRFLTLGTGQHQQAAPSSSALVQPAPTKRRHQRYIDLILGSNPFDYSQPNQNNRPWDNNYGSYGWNNYYGGNENNDDYQDDYYYYDYDEDDYEGGSASGQGDENNDTEKGGDDLYTENNDVKKILPLSSPVGNVMHVHNDVTMTV